MYPSDTRKNEDRLRNENGILCRCSGEWFCRADEIETVALRVMDAAVKLCQLGAHTAACQAGGGHGGCEPECARLRKLILPAGAEGGRRLIEFLPDEVDHD
jgi:hypothetical protein